MNLTELATRVERLHSDWLAAHRADPDTRERMILAAAELAEQTLRIATQIRAQLVELRDQFARIHVMGVDDMPTAADYRDHDEHNADVREAIHHSAEELADQLDNWLAEPNSVPTDNQEFHA